MGDHATSTDSAFLRELFLQRLPSQVRMVLASADDSVSLAQLAQLADKILEVAVPSSVASVETPSSLASDVEQLRAPVSELQETIKNLRRPSHPPRPPSLSRSCSPCPSSPVSQTLCWYHQKYGDAAKKCKPPCDWLKGQSGDGCCWPFFKSPILCHGQVLWYSFPGADVSVIPPSHTDRSHRQDFCLQAVNNTPDTHIRYSIPHT